MTVGTLQLCLRTFLSFVSLIAADKMGAGCSQPMKYDSSSRDVAEWSFLRRERSRIEDDSHAI